jgi:KaiC/GvpD/RAD55 family RecA-like ATPase
VADNGAARGGRPPSDLVSSGLADLDVLLGDGVPQGYAVLVVVPAGELALRLTESFILGGLTGGEGLILTLSTLSAGEFATRTQRYNIDLASLGDKARIIDWYSWRRERFTGIRDDGQVTKISKDLVNVEVAVTRAKRKLMKAAPRRRAVFDWLGPALADYERQEALDIARSVIAKMRADRITSFWLLAGERVHEKELASLIDLFDGAVSIRGKGDEFEVQILNLRARPFSRERHSLKMGMDGSLVVGLVPMSRAEGAGAAQGPSGAAPEEEGHGISFTVRATAEKPKREEAEPAPEAEAREAPSGDEAVEVAGLAAGGRDLEAAEVEEEPPPPPPRPATPATPRAAKPPAAARAPPPLPPALPRPAPRPSEPAAKGKSRVPAVAAAVAVAVLLLLLVLMQFLPLGPRHAVTLDGKFDDWARIIKHADRDGAWRKGGIQLEEYAMEDDGGRLCVYARTSQEVTAGQGARVVFLLDTDSDPATGYDARGLGADASLTISGGSGEVEGFVSDFEGGDRGNWSSWSGRGSVPAAASPDGDEVEACASGDAGFTSSRATVAVVGPSGQDDVSACSPSPGRACVVASVVPKLYSFDANDTPFELILDLAGGEASVTSVSFSGAKVVVSDLPKLPWRLLTTETTRIPLKIDTAGMAAGLVKLGIEGSSIAVDADVTVARGEGRAHYGAPPAGHAVDGLLGNWTGLVNASAVGPPTADLSRVGTSLDGSLQVFVADFSGDALRGTAAPGKHSAGGGKPGPPVPLPRVSGEDKVRVYVDSDDDLFTGHRKHGLGAEYVIEVNGTAGRITARSLLKWDGVSSLRYHAMPDPVAEVTPECLEAGAPKSSLGIAGNWSYVVEATDWGEGFDKAGSRPGDPMVVRPDGTGWRGDIGSWSGFTLPQLPEGRNWVDIAAGMNGEVAILRDDGEVYFTDGAGSGANWLRQSGTRPAGWTSSSFVGIGIRQNQAVPTNFYILRSDGSILSATTGDTNSASAAWSAYTTTGLPAATAYVDVAASRNGNDFPIVLRNDGATFWSNSGGAWVSGSMTGLPAATDYVALSAARPGNCGGGAQDGMVIARRNGAVFCNRAPQAAGGTWSAYGTGGGPPASGSYVSLAYDDGNDYVYLLRNDGVAYRTGGTGTASAWTVAGGTGTAVPASTAYVGIASQGRGAATQFTAYVLRTDGGVYSNPATNANTPWVDFGTGTAVPAGGGAWASIGARDGTGAFVLASNGTVMRSDDQGSTWATFGDAAPDYSWTAIDVTPSFVYIMANDGWVERAPVATGTFAGWNILKTWSATDASWVSLSTSFDGGISWEVRALRNDGATEIASELSGNWGSWGDADAGAGHFRMVGIASDGGNVYAAANHGAVSKSPASSASWGVNAGAWITPANASFVDVAATESVAGSVWLLRNDGEVLRSSDSANSFPARGFVSGSPQPGNAGYVSLAAVPEAGPSGTFTAATAVLCSLASALAIQRRRRAT